jgi:hypothetical protein
MFHDMCTVLYCALWWSDAIKKLQDFIHNDLSYKSYPNFRLHLQDFPPRNSCNSCLMNINTMDYNLKGMCIVVIENSERWRLGIWH